MDTDIPIVYKICRVCGCDITDQNKTANHNYKDGISTICSVCNNAAARKWRLRLRELGGRSRKDLCEVDIYCRTCGKRLTEGSVSTNPYTKSGYAYECKKCSRRRSKEYRRRIKCGEHTPKDTLGTVRHCYVCGIALNQDNAYRDLYSSTGLDNHCKKCDRILRQTWSKNNPERESIIKQRRRTIKKNLPNTFTAEDWINCKDYFDCRCAICGSLDHIQMDHWIPLSSPFSPGTVKENIIPLCRSCNSSKNSHNPYKYLVSRYGVQKAVIVYNNIRTYFNFVLTR